MEGFPRQDSLIGARIASFYQRAMRIAMRAAVALGLSTVLGIVIGAASTENGFVQLIVTLLATAALWLPMLLVVSVIDRFLLRGGEPRRSARPLQAARSPGRMEAGWDQLLSVAPAHSDRIRALRNSLERSRQRLGDRHLDADAHDLCVLIDRRLPELIDREVANLAPDDVHRGRQVEELLALVEQFARHCSGSNGGRSDDPSFEAAVLRRRFEARLGSDPENSGL